MLALVFHLLVGAAPVPDLLVVVNKSDDSVTILDRKTGARRATVPVGRGPHEVEVLADRRTAAVSNYGPPDEPGETLTLVDLDRGAAVGTIYLGEEARPHGLEALPDGRLLVTAEGLRALLVVDPKRGQVTAKIPTRRQVSHMVVASPDGARAYVASLGSGTVSTADVQTRRIVSDLATGAGAEGIDRTPDGREIWVGNREDDTVSVVDAATLTLLATIPMARYPIRLKITPDGKRALVSCAQSGDVAVVDVGSRRLVRRIALDRTAVSNLQGRSFSTRFGRSPTPIGLLIAPDGKQAWVASTNADVVSVIDLEKMTVVATLATGREPDGLSGRFSR